VNYRVTVYRPRREGVPPLFLGLNISVGRAKMSKDTKSQSGSAIAMQGITKRFPGGVVANDAVDFELQVGEIHGLLGENGAGKTTLMNILYGLYQPDGGTIRVFGQPAVFGSPADAIRSGIGMVHQHFKLVSDMTVTENVVLGLKSSKGFLTDTSSADTRISALAERHGLQVDPKAQIWQLAVGQRQRVEILKALYRDARILILDEPTSVLAPSEVKDFFKSLRGLRESGISVVLITHKLDEVMDVTDRVTVLRKGRKVATQSTDSVNQESLAHMMIDEAIPPVANKMTAPAHDVILQVTNLRVFDDRGIEALRGISLEVRKGEILGIAGVSGNGQRELVEALVGLRKPASGSIAFAGKDVTGKAPRDVIDLGVAYVPENRTEDASVADFRIDENLILKDFNKAPVCGMLASKIPTFLNDREIRSRAERAITQFGIRATGISAKARSLSGGNLQRLILARELSGSPMLIVVSQPTRGLDVAATEYVRNLLIQQRNRGAAVLLVDEDLAELIALSDRIAVMYKGETVGLLEPRQFSSEEIGLLMTGTKRMAAAA
jgi:general nucleoside transport system ATP-binding protein